MHAYIKKDDHPTGCYFLGDKLDEWQDGNHYIWWAKIENFHLVLFFDHAAAKRCLYMNPGDIVPIELSIKFIEEKKQ